MVYVWENPIKMDDNWGYPNFRKPPYILHPLIFLGTSLTSYIHLGFLKLEFSQNAFNVVSFIDHASISCASLDGSRGKGSRCSLLITWKILLICQCGGFLK